LLEEAQKKYFKRLEELPEKDDEPKPHNLKEDFINVLDYVDNLCQRVTKLSIHEKFLFNWI